MTGRKRDTNANPIGKYNKTPILDTRIYEATFPDGHTAEYAANIIAECLYSQTDSEDHQYVLLDDLIDWKRTKEAVEDSDIFQISSNGNIHHQQTTKGWQLCVWWKDGSTSREHLKDLKESYSIQTAEFAISQKLADKPAFKWWVNDTVK